MGLFDEIERSIKEAMAEAQKAQRPQQPAPQRQSEPEPEYHEPAPRQLTPFEEFAAQRQRAQEEAEKAERERQLHEERLAEQQEEIDNAYAIPTQDHVTSDISGLSTSETVQQLLKSRNGLAAAIIANEVLGPPLALRKHRR